jgi:hypothetical protein
MSTYSAPKGVPPKPPSQRRRRNKPASYGAAEPVLTGQGQEQPPLGFDAHALVADMWSALAQSVEGQFYSAADWERARLEMWQADKLVRSGQPTANQWAALQRGMDELLISPAVKRRAGIELKRAVDVDADAAVSMVSRYRQSLKSV